MRADESQQGEGEGPAGEPSIEAMGRDRPLAWLGFGLEGPVYRLVVWCFVVGSVCHLWLADAWQWEWLPANLLYVVGIAILAWRGALAGWLLSGLGLALPLLFHRDVLTQSMFLLFVSLAGVWATGRGERDAFLKTVRWLTILVYGLAVFHKLNADFLNPQYSCALYGLDEVAGYWHLPTISASSPLAEGVPWLILGSEAAIAVLHVAGYRRICWSFAVGFHIFLTFTMAPAFVFVMLVGHAAFARPADLRQLGDLLARRWPALSTIALLATTASIAAHRELPDWSMIPREFALWGLLAALIWAFPPWRAAGWVRDGGPPADGGRWLPRIAAALFLLNGLTPYLGLQYQHTAAMVSNLRIDRGCWNHLLVPESTRLQDPYIRIEEAYFGEPGAIPDYEEVVERQLWSPPQIRQMRRNWCRPEVRPFHLTGTYRGESFAIEDLCADEPLPFGEWRVFGEAVFGDFLRFQKNLRRRCPQTCIH